jgi:class 3 adenylate cyclase
MRFNPSTLTLKPKVRSAADADWSLKTEVTQVFGYQYVDCVQLVTTLFSQLDLASFELDVFKVCTIGDCYVATSEFGEKGGSASAIRSSVKNLITFAYAIVLLVGSNRACRVNNIHIRIGMHIGEFVDGVIGNTTLRYDIWGQDVVVANEVEAHGKADRILISEDLRNFCLKAPIGIRCTPYLGFKSQRRWVKTHLLKKFHIPITESNRRAVTTLKDKEEEVPSEESSDTGTKRKNVAAWI